MKKRTTIKFTLLAVFAGLFLTASAQAATYTVNQIGDAGDGTCDATCTLRDAILTANGTADNDIIGFDAGVFGTAQTITLGGTELTIANNGTLMINGTGESLLTVSGGNASRVFVVNDSATATISGLTVSDGNGVGSSNNGNGGGIFINFRGTLNLTNSTIRNNSAADGGGILNGGTLNLTNSAIHNNSATNDGGGIYNDGTSTITNSTIRDNTTNRFGGGISAFGSTTINNSAISNNSAATGGGGIAVLLSTTTISNSTISNNSAATGGGIYSTGGGAAFTLANSTVSSNTATSGGGIYTNGAISNIIDSTVSNNTATDGGGIYIFINAVRPNITNSTVSNNMATGDGGGIYSGNIRGTTLTNSTVSNNSATGNGGGVYNLRTTNITNSTVSNNSAASGGGIYNFNGISNLQNTIIANSTGGGDCVRPGGTVNATYSLIEDGFGCVNGTNSNNLTGDPNLGLLQNNGGATETHALLPGSIAIDAGNSTLTTDQRGATRPVDDPNSPNGTGNLADIGSFEVQAPTAASVTIGGRVLSGERGVARATVHLTDQNGNVRTAKTNSFGFYRFTDVAGGQSLILNVFHKQYQFTPQIVTANNAVDNLDFTAQTN